MYLLLQVPAWILQLLDSGIPAGLAVQLPFYSGGEEGEEEAAGYLCH